MLEKLIVGATMVIMVLSYLILNQNPEKSKNNKLITILLKSLFLLSNLFKKQIHNKEK